MRSAETGSSRRSAPLRVPIFFHVGKTGGSTLNRVIERHYAADEIYTFRGLPNRRALAVFAALPKARRAGLRLVRGHMPLGVDEAIPGPSAYFTFLRDPVERVLSSYYFIYRAESHPLHAWMMRRRLSLDELLDSRWGAGFDNGQTRLLSGEADAVFSFDDDGTPQPPQLGRGECDESLLERAKRHLAERFVVVGQTERFDETALAVCREFGWRLPLAERRNVGLNRPTDALAPATRRRLEHLNELDRRLHAFAGELLDRRLAKEDASFHRDLRRVRWINRWASSRAGAALLRLRRSLRRSGAAG